ncbi:MAG TPA: hypothetical protein VFQ87_14050 [Bradyrhizobium sp.]|nr:hypothetical protein [Bradyrhizobium sp.]
MMRTTSFLLALAFILCGPSMAGPSDSNLPGVGTFSFTAVSGPAVAVAN